MAEIELKSEYDYQLLVPFSYASGGEQVEASTIKLTAPAAKHRRACGMLKQAFFHACQRETSGQEATGNEEITGQDIVETLISSDKVKFEDVLDVMAGLLVAGVAKVDGEVKMNKHMLDNLNQEDLEGMLGEYLANFTLASSLAQMKEKSSKA